MKATVTFDVSEEEIELFNDNLKFFSVDTHIRAEERAITHLMGCISNENIRNIEYLNKPIRPININFNK